jgi:hypothetical protein
MYCFFVNICRYFVSSGWLSLPDNWFLLSTHMWHCFFVGGNKTSVCLKLYFARYSFSIANVGSSSFRILAAPFLAVFGVIVPFSRLMFFSRSLCSSTGLNPVSLSILNIVVYFLVKVGIIVFTCSAVGTLGSLSSLAKNGFSHFRP